MRKQGILMPVTAIPSNYGIGTMGKESYRFIDFLEKSGNRLWQILPLGPTGYGDSPYQSFSTFAGNPYYIDLELLIEEGYLTQKECEAYDFGAHVNTIDYEKIYLSRFEILRKAWIRALDRQIENDAEYIEFKKKNAYWLLDYSLYMAVKDYFGGVCFMEWEEDIRLRKEHALQEYRRKLAGEIAFYEFLQYLFAKQWKALKNYANKKGIEIIGDIPIYVAFDSADTWANPKLFLLDEEGMPIGVAGCPPDAFSVTGQLWGNPLYDWSYHEETGYEWWINRIAYCYEWYDVLRIDHFRGFDEYWFVPYGDETAENGHWEKGPGYALFDTMQKKLGKKKVIAEDLGFLTESVIELVKKTGYPRMKILQFAFDAWKDSEYLPHNYDKNCVVYTGTHDNDTTVGFIEKMPKKDIQFAREYLQVRGAKGLCWEMIRAALSSVADMAIIPMQDYLELGSKARMNVPSTLGTNWKWRMDKDALTEELAAKIYKMAKIYGRL
ncbi:MAG: 4-alpha-glucanotransferase [Lachnospiraceae bacterium]|nr:4-alpha-glucanotransferase [Lachnospiraceae bacterium]